MSSVGRKSFAKPPRASGEGFENIKAAKETFCDLTYQIRCLNELYNQLIPQANGNHRRASCSAGDYQEGGPQRDPKVLQQLRLLKANLRSKYLGNPLLFSSLEHLKVVVMFDEKKQPFFDFRLRPVSDYPVGYPFFIDDNEGTIVGLSEAIYRKVLKAVQEEEEGRGFEEGDNNSLNRSHNHSHAAEKGMIRVNIKEEVDDDEEEEEKVELITLDDDSDDEMQQEERYNSPGSANSAAAAASVAVPPAASATVRGHQMNPRRLSTTVFSSKSKPHSQLPLSHKNNNKRPAANLNAAQPQGNSKRAKISTAPGTSSSSTRAKTASQAVAEHFLASADFRKAAEGQKFDCPLCEKPYMKAAMKDHLELAHTKRGQYVPYRCTYPGCTYTNVWGVNARAHARREHNGRNGEQYIVKTAAAVVVPKTPGFSLASSSSSSSAANRATTTTASTTTSTLSAASTSQQQQHQRPSTSTSTAQMLSSFEDYLRSKCPAYVAAKTARTRVTCPDCSKSMYKFLLMEHFIALHLRLKPYHCQWPGCSFTTGYRAHAARHVKNVHKGSSYAQYIVYREE